MCKACNLIVTAHSRLLILVGEGRGGKNGESWMDRSSFSKEVMFQGREILNWDRLVQGRDFFFLLEGFLCLCLTLSKYRNSGCFFRNIEKMCTRAIESFRE